MEFKNYDEEKLYYEQVANQEDFLEWYKEQDLKKYKTPSVTTDNVIFAYDKEEDSLKLLLIKRKANPFRGKYAITGGFANPNEDLDDTCIRETYEETKIKLEKGNIEQLYTFSTPHRDPRTWVITVAYLVFLPKLINGVASDDADELCWFDIRLNSEGDIILSSDKDIINLSKDCDKLAFDHADILKTAMFRIKNKINYQLNILNVLGEDFTLVEARKVIAKIVGKSYKDIDNSNFRKTHGHLFEDLNYSRKGNVGKPAKVYKLK